MQDFFVQQTGQIMEYKTLNLCTKIDSIGGSTYKLILKLSVKS